MILGLGMGWGSHWLCDRPSEFSNTRFSVGADVHHARQCADGHDAWCRSHAREHAHARAHVHDCGPEPVHVYVHDYGHACENATPSWWYSFQTVLFGNVITLLCVLEEEELRHDLRFVSSHRDKSD